MRLAHRTTTLLLTGLVLVTFLAACGAASATPGEAVQLNEEQVTGIVNNMLKGYNAADYAAFSRDFGTPMKLLIDEGLFKEFCTESAGSIGQYQSISSLKQVETNAHSTTWSVTAQFELTSQAFNITLLNDTGKIEGMDFGPQG